LNSTAPIDPYSLGVLVDPNLVANEAPVLVGQDAADRLFDSREALEYRRVGLADRAQETVNAARLR